MVVVYGLMFEYVKFYGVLYNDMMSDECILNVVMCVVVSYFKLLKLMILVINFFVKY